MDITGRGGVGVITSASNQLWRLTLLLPWFGNFVQDPSLFLPTTHFFVYRDRIVSYNRCTKHSSRWPGSPELYVRSLFPERWAVFNRSILIASAFASINGLHSSPSITHQHRTCHGIGPHLRTSFTGSAHSLHQSLVVVGCSELCRYRFDMNHCSGILHGPY